jgi:hypothetical protein
VVIFMMRSSKRMVPVSYLGFSSQIRPSVVFW